MPVDPLPFAPTPIVRRPLWAVAVTTQVHVLTFICEADSAPEALQMVTAVHPIPPTAAVGVAPHNIGPLRKRNYGRTRPVAGSGDSADGVSNLAAISGHEILEALQTASQPCRSPDQIIRVFSVTADE